MNELELSAELFLQTVAEAAAEGRSVIVAGTGDSMLPFIRPETDKLLLSPLPERPLLPGDIVLYRRPNGQAVIHRILRAEGDRFDLVGDHQIMIDRNVPRAALVAYVKQVIRPEGIVDCDTDAARRKACRETERRLHPPKETLLRHYARAVKRRIANKWNKRKQL